MPTALPAPDLKIPSSPNTVSVYIIDAGRISNISPWGFMQPKMAGLDDLDAPCYTFLIKHDNPAAKSKYDTLIFDLGLRKDFENSPKVLVERAKNVTIKVEKDVREILLENGEDPANVGGIIWSHYHLDHTGDPSKFPPSTDLIVGPGFKSRFVPCWPTVPDGEVDEAAWAGRSLVEISFPSSESAGGTNSDDDKNVLLLGSFAAHDLYGDGSFYLLDSPGHATGHLCALARTRASPHDEFIVLGGDVVHHPAEFRPTEWLPLPDEIRPDPRRKEAFVRGAATAAGASVCPGAVFASIHPTGDVTAPFLRPEGRVHDDPSQLHKSVRKWMEFDAQENVFAVAAHDRSLYDVIEYYPRSANDWREKGWKVDGRWRFLEDFETGSDEGEKSRI